MTPAVLPRRPGLRRHPWRLVSLSMTELVHLEVARGIATITLDSQHNRNALSAQLRQELAGHLDASYSDDGVRVIVLTHAGSVFCSGMDLKEASGGAVAGQEVPRILESIWTSPQPVVARLGGPAPGGGAGVGARGGGRSRGCCGYRGCRRQCFLRIHRGADRRRTGGHLGHRPAAVAA